MCACHHRWQLSINLLQLYNLFCFEFFHCKENILNGYRGRGGSYGKMKAHSVLLFARFFLTTIAFQLKSSTLRSLCIMLSNCCSGIQGSVTGNNEKKGPLTGRSSHQFSTLRLIIPASIQFPFKTVTRSYSILLPFSSGVLSCESFGIFFYTNLEFV